MTELSALKDDRSSPVRVRWNLGWVPRILAFLVLPLFWSSPLLSAEIKVGSVVEIPGELKFFAAVPKSESEHVNHCHDILFFQAITNFPTVAHSWLIGVETG